MPRTIHEERRWGFSLNEAARIGRTLTGREHALRCPRCGATLGTVAGRGPEGRVRLVRCDGCGRGVVLDESTMPGGFDRG